MEPTRILIVANQTAGGDPLVDEVRRRSASGSCVFHLVVPATPPREHLTWTEGEAHELAQKRLDDAVARFREIGIDMTGEVGDERPLDAIAAAIGRQRVDEIILSTLPSGISRWLKQDLSHRIERQFMLPTTTVVARREQVLTS